MSHIKNIDVTHETSDVNVGGIVKFVIGLTIFAIAVQVLMWGMFRFLNSQEEGKDPAPGPMAMTEQERRPPDPKLQAAPGFGVKLENGQWLPLENREPQAEYRILLEQWDAQLNCTRGWGSDVLSRHKECMPIDQAMQKVLEGKESTLSNQGGPAEDYGIDMPTAASSGRMTEKRRQ